MLEKVPTERVAQALRFLKAEGKQTDQRIADRIGMSQSSVHRRLSEETPMTLDDLTLLARALGHDVTVSFSPQSTPAVSAVAPQAASPRDGGGSSASAPDSGSGAEDSSAA
jgi:transcriptional regulator with XRE-family HTH domain